MQITRKTLAAAVAAAVAGLAVPELSSSAAAADPNKGKEKCYGVAKAGENGCASANGSHSCGGLSKVNFSGQEWKLVAAGTCEKMGGKLEPFSGTGKVSPLELLKK